MEHARGIAYFSAVGLEGSAMFRAYTAVAAISHDACATWNDPPRGAKRRQQSKYRGDRVTVAMLFVRVLADYVLAIRACAHQLATADHLLLFRAHLYNLMETTNLIPDADVDRTLALIKATGIGAYVDDNPNIRALLKQALRTELVRSSLMLDGTGRRRAEDVGLAVMMGALAGPANSEAAAADAKVKTPFTELGWVRIKKTGVVDTYAIDDDVSVMAVRKALTLVTGAFQMSGVGLNADMFEVDVKRRVVTAGLLDMCTLRLLASFLILVDRYVNRRSDDGLVVCMSLTMPLMRAVYADTPPRAHAAHTSVKGDEQRYKSGGALVMASYLSYLTGMRLGKCMSPVLPQMGMMNQAHSPVHGVLVSLGSILSRFRPDAWKTATDTQRVAYTTDLVRRGAEHAEASLVRMHKSRKAAATAAANGVAVGVRLGDMVGTIQYVILRCVHGLRPGTVTRAALLAASDGIVRVLTGECVLPQSYDAPLLFEDAFVGQGRNHILRRTADGRYVGSESDGGDVAVSADTMACLMLLCVNIVECDADAQAILRGLLFADGAFTCWWLRGRRHDARNTHTAMGRATDWNITRYRECDTQNSMFDTYMPVGDEFGKGVAYAAQPQQPGRADEAFTMTLLFTCMERDGKATLIKDKSGEDRQEDRGIVFEHKLAETVARERFDALFMPATSTGVVHARAGPAGCMDTPIELCVPCVRQTHGLRCAVTVVGPNTAVTCVCPTLPRAHIAPTAAFNLRAKILRDTEKEEARPCALVAGTIDALYTQYCNDIRCSLVHTSYVMVMKNRLQFHSSMALFNGITSLGGGGGDGEYSYEEYSEAGDDIYSDDDDDDENAVCIRAAVGDDVYSDDDDDENAVCIRAAVGEPAAKRVPGGARVHAPEEDDSRIDPAVVAAVGEKRRRNV
jgi:hypothetical protein